MRAARKPIGDAQKLYRGSNQIGWLLGVQVAALLVASIPARPERRVMVLTLLALGCVLAAQALFWIFTARGRRRLRSYYCRHR